MICKSCGFENPDGMNFCGRCSTPLSDLPIGVVTYLFTDIEGSTPLWQSYPERMGAVLARHDALLTSVIEEHEGFVVTSRGEGPFGAAWSHEVTPSSFVPCARMARSRTQGAHKRGKYRRQGRYRDGRG
jgi:class 3 adenylate cyclase